MDRSCPFADVIDTLWEHCRIEQSLLAFIRTMDTLSTIIQDDGHPQSDTFSKLPTDYKGCLTLNHERLEDLLSYRRPGRTEAQGQIFAHRSLVRWGGMLGRGRETTMPAATAIVEECGRESLERVPTCHSPPTRKN
jgi:hypothetical protein